MRLGLRLPATYHMGLKDAMWMCSSVGMHDILLDMSYLLGAASSSPDELLQLVRSTEVRASVFTTLQQIAGSLAELNRYASTIVGLYVEDSEDNIEASTLREEPSSIGVDSAIASLPFPVFASTGLLNGDTGEATENGHIANFQGIFAVQRFDTTSVDPIAELQVIAGGSSKQLCAVEVDITRVLHMDSDDSDRGYWLDQVDRLIRFTETSELLCIIVAPNPDIAVESADFIHRRRRSILRGELMLEEFS